jgi:hypothetical protein
MTPPRAGCHPEALERDAPHLNAVRFALESRQREQQGGDRPSRWCCQRMRDRDAPVRGCMRSETYDQLKDPSDD